MYGQKILVTQKGFHLLQTKIQSAMDELKRTQSQKGLALELGGNSWHDNFDFEELVRQETVINKRLADLFEIQNRIVLVSKPTSTLTLQIGHIATITNIDDGSERTFEVGGYGETDLLTKPQLLDYTAPLVKGFIGYEVDHEEKIVINEKKQAFSLTNIKLKDG